MAIAKEIDVPDPIRGKSIVAFDEHAIKRMKERKISEAQVIATLQKPDMKGLRADEGRHRVRRHYGSHTSIDVVFEIHKERILVISAIRVAKEN